MVSSAQRRAEVDWAQTAYQLLERREGSSVNRERVHRLSRDEGLQLQPRRRNRRTAATVRVQRRVVTTPTTRREMDRMPAALANGQTFRFPYVHVATRDCLFFAAEPRCTTEAVTHLLEVAGCRRGQLLAVIQCDSGAEFTSITLDLWADTHAVQLDLSRPGKPGDNCTCEAFDGSAQRECFTMHSFGSLPEARHRLAQWQNHYNSFRPHTSHEQVASDTDEHSAQ